MHWSCTLLPATRASFGSAPEDSKDFPLGVRTGPLVEVANRRDALHHSTECHKACLQYPEPPRHPRRSAIATHNKGAWDYAPKLLQGLPWDALLQALSWHKRPRRCPQHAFAHCRKAELLPCGSHARTYIDPSLYEACSWPAHLRSPPEELALFLAARGCESLNKLSQPWALMHSGLSPQPGML